LSRIALRSPNTIDLVDGTTGTVIKQYQIKDTQHLIFTP
jgi:hypothetical protein